MVGYGGDAKDPGRVPSPGGQADHGDDRNTWGRRGVEISPGGGGNGSHVTTPHNIVH